MKFNVLFSYTDEQAIKIHLENCGFDKFGQFYYFITLIFDSVIWHYTSENGNTVYIEKVKRNSKILTSIEEVIGLFIVGIGTNLQFGYSLKGVVEAGNLYEMTLIQRETSVTDYPDERPDSFDQVESSINDITNLCPFTLTIKEIKVNDLLITTDLKISGLKGLFEGIFQGDAYLVKEEQGGAFSVTYSEKNMTLNCIQICRVRLLFGFQNYFNNQRDLVVLNLESHGNVHTATYSLRY